MTTYVCQGDSRWAHTALGRGKHTHGEWGCACACITEGAFRLGRIAHKDPRLTSDAGVAAGAFAEGASAAVLELLAGAVGVKMGPRVELETGVMAKAVASYLASGRLVMLHVDHDSTLPKGDAAPDHWLLALRVGPLGIECADPATGEGVTLTAATLSGASHWRDHRPFRVVAFRTLS